MRMLKTKIVLLIFLFTVLGYCASNQDNGGTDGTTVPIPSITSVLPSAIFDGSPSFDLYITGRNFSDDIAVFINQKLKKDTSLFEDTITCLVGPEDWNGTLNVMVGNPVGATYKFSYQMTVPILTEGNITFSTPRVIVRAESYGYQDIETDNHGNLYVVYQETSDIFLVHSPDYGQTWGQPVNVSNTSRYSDYSDLTVGPAGDLFICWWEADAGIVEESDIYFSRSTDNGVSWVPPARILPAYSRIDDPRIYADAGGGVNMVFLNIEGQYDIPYFYFARSTDNGGVWNVVRVGEGAEMVQYPLEEDHNGVFHTAYVTYTGSSSGYGLTYARSTDRGLTWTSRMVSDEISGFRGHVFPAIKSSGDSLYAAWNYSLMHHAGSRQEAFFSRSLDGGQTWGPEMKMDEIVYNCSGDKVDLVVDSEGNIFLLISFRHVFLTRSADGGETWTPPMFINKSEVHAHPCMTIDNMDNLFIVWSDNGKMFFCRNETPLSGRTAL